MQAKTDPPFEVTSVYATVKFALVCDRYRKRKLDIDMYLVARCKVHSVIKINNQRCFLTLKALNNFGPSIQFFVPWHINHPVKLGQTIWYAFIVVLLICTKYTMIVNLLLLAQTQTCS